MTVLAATRDFITAARALIADPARFRVWILAADDNGNQVSPLGDAAGYCVHGALQHVTGRRDWANADWMTPGGLASVLYGTAGSMFPEMGGADVLGNNNNILGHPAVMCLLDAALAVTEAELILAGEALVKVCPAGGQP